MKNLLDGNLKTTRPVRRKENYRDNAVAKAFFKTLSMNVFIDISSNHFLNTHYLIDGYLKNDTTPKNYILL